MAPLRQPPEPAQAVDIELRIEPLAAVTSCGSDYPVAALPGPKHVRGKARPERDEADGVAGGAGIEGLGHG